MLSSNIWLQLKHKEAKNDGMAPKYPTGSGVLRWLLPTMTVSTGHGYNRQSTTVSADRYPYWGDQQGRLPAPPTPCRPAVSPANGGHVPHKSATVICDFDGVLLRSSSTFPYFMLVSMEAGSLLRALLLLCLYPVLCLLTYDMSLKLMTFVSFFGLRRDAFRAGITVLPKHLLDAVGKEGVEALVTKGKGRRKICVTSMPRVMVECFLREYLGVDLVVGREIVTLAGYYTGVTTDSRMRMLLDRLGQGGRGTGAIAIMGKQLSTTGFDRHLHQVFSLCEQVQVISDKAKHDWSPMSQEDQKNLLVKPLIFHDGRVAFRPTPATVLGAFLWLPLGFVLAFLRTATFLILPYRLSMPILAFTGIHVRAIRSSGDSPTKTKPESPPRLYVCNHRTLLDPLYISLALGQSVTAVTYSLSRVSEFLSPIRTVRLTRDREKDRRAMVDSLRRPAPLVVCPEGTTCREPYLLRFSQLFTELGEEVAPVALESWVGTFHGTTAAGTKGLDPLFFLMNPTPFYTIRFLERVSLVASGDEKDREVANLIQELVAEALGYECTSLTRRDKYRLLAGNEGCVK